jgi:hypothetical protein
MPGKTFPVRLKEKDGGCKKVNTKKVNKLIAISDIEGNFMAFTETAAANGVIDTNFNWTFGEGHLVLTGDFFDRGTQVTEVLWLIYSLEEKAKDAGGYVHYILGNHEIMNLSVIYAMCKPKIHRECDAPWTAVCGFCMVKIRSWEDGFALRTSLKKLEIHYLRMVKYRLK